ncbi:hypothetical protein QBC38DRAFT_524222 [Podospora fimiseda]|uniref:Uncharacterized protein n=1 Tax=Podospora fimiseda TaxID=252190 RepID=A0AAN6YMV5_9PEZI|nr:hypothetical protein QBC38DRAFT_524222 [Podospora fimiseda]
MWPLWKIVAYIHHVGGLSLSCLLLGGGMLIMFGINVLVGRHDSNNTVQLDTPLLLLGKSAIIFRFGSHLNVQFWLAVLGVSFGLWSYGLSGTYTHLFDLWCTWRASDDQGLDYARYLNSQPRASGFGFRGFRFFAFLQHLITALGIIASVGYKFAVVQVNGDAVFHVDEASMGLRLPSTDAFLDDGSTSPWLGDLNPKWRNTTRAFIHNKDQHVEETDNTNHAPGSIIMATQAFCKDDSFEILDFGNIITLEVVMVATRSERQQDFELLISDSANSQGWVRVRTEAPGWFPDSQRGTVVEYRADSSGLLEVQYGESLEQPSRNEIQNQSTPFQQPVMQRFTYNMSLSVAEVTRVVKSGGCAHIKNITFVIHNIGGAAERKQGNGVDVKNQHWITAVIQDHATGPIEGIGVIVRNAMVALAPNLTDYSGYSLGHAPGLPTVSPSNKFAMNKTQPWIIQQLHIEANSTDGGKQWRDNHDCDGWRLKTPPCVLKNWPGVNSSYWEEENILIAMQRLRLNQSGLPDYPYYKGQRFSSRVGSYDKAAWTFILLGIIACLLAVFRVLSGPAQLTSWMGQHVYLALEGKIQKDGTEKLACGRQPAYDLGTVRMEVTEHGLWRYLGYLLWGYLGYLTTWPSGAKLGLNYTGMWVSTM